jgi:hypothetical protein
MGGAFSAGFSSGFGGGAVTNSAQLRQAVLLLAGRFYRSADAPFGVVGSVDHGVANVRKRQPDVDALLYGYRGAIPSSQTWPTVSDLAASVLNVPASALTPEKQDLLAQALDAAVEYVIAQTSQAFGVA